MKNKGRMQIFENKKVVSGPRDYQENVRRSKLCRVDKFSAKAIATPKPQSPKRQNKMYIKHNNNTVKIAGNS